MNRRPQGTRADAEVRRSASQIMFGHLPQQTVDINQGVWRIDRWRNPQVERAIDVEALRDEVLAAAQPWIAAERDGRYGELLRAGRRPLVVHSLDRDNGVEALPFPRLWLCANQDCRRVHTSPISDCACGSRGRRAQLHFVAYCSDCGAQEEPTIFRCPTHCVSWKKSHDRMAPPGGSSPWVSSTACSRQCSLNPAQPTSLGPEPR